MQTALTPSAQASAPDLARQVGFVVATLREVIGRGFAGNPHHFRLGVLVWYRIRHILKRFQDLMDRLAAGRLPRQRRGPHTGGAPHPENLGRGNPLPTNRGWLVTALGWEVVGCGWQLEQVLAEPAAAEILARVPAAERILRPLRRMLGMGPFHPIPRRTPAPARTPATTPPPAPAPVHSPPPELPPPSEPAARSPAWNWYGVFPPFKKPA